VLRTRLIVGTVMAVGAVGVLAFDFGPEYPGLHLLSLLLGVFATTELRRLIPEDSRPVNACVLIGVYVVLWSNWHCISPYKSNYGQLTTWMPVLAALVASVLTVTLYEIRMYKGDGHATARLATTIFVIVYLGLLPSFLIRLRWLPDDRAGVALLLAIFVPKCGDIGAYFTGRLFGRTPFAPTLSPKKTWEGFAGGMVFAVATAVGLSFAAPVFRYGIPEAIAFGLAVGLAGVFGDLAESMMKRDAMAKDASASVPGFGGVLDVIDSVIFAAPVAYLFLAW
jgi:phosphatidate cytidylyltransferase